MIHLRSVELGSVDAALAQRFPFSVPVIQALQGKAVSFTSAVTIFVGENGSGKSTLLEAIACAAGSVPIGSAELGRDPTLATVRTLANRLRLTWQKRTRAGFFLRAEDFFGYARRLRQMREELQAELDATDREYADKSPTAQTYARMPYARELGELQERYGGDLDGCSHGESFLTLFQARFVPDGLYLLDEPEAPLSPLRQLTLLSLLHAMVEQGNSQFVIVTQSPLLMAYPGATLYSFDGGAIHPIRYDEIEHVTLMRDFLNAPERFFRHLFQEG